MAERMGVLRRVLADARLRRVELAFFGFGAAEYGVWVAVLVYAYERGGTTASAVMAALQLLPAALVAPFAAVIADRRGGAVALRIGYLAQALSIGGSAVAMLLAAPPAAVWAGAIVAASAVTLTRPAQLALLPALVDTPVELTAANVVSGWVESVSMLVGPAAAGLMMALAGPGAALALYAGVTALGAVLVTPLARSPAAVRSAAGIERPATPLAVMRIIARDPRITSALAIVIVEFVAIGALDVLAVVLAINVLGLGAGAAGYLGAAFGAGGVLGAMLALALVGRQRVSGALLGAALAWGAAFVAIGAWPAAAAAFALLGACGMSRAVLDVAARTMLHRVVPAPLHGRVFGVLESLTMLGLAIGSLSVPALVALAGAEAAWVGIGLLLVLVALAAMRTLSALDRDPSLEAVTGSRSVHRAAPELVARRLETSEASRVG